MGSRQWPSATNLEKRVPQSHLYSRVPQILMWAFQSDWTAYFLEHLSHFHFFSPCLRLFHGKLWPRRCSCRFWSLWNPLLHISQMKRFVAISVFVPGSFLVFLADAGCCF
ncbi:unnamed protein product [Spirodela intermedia]|uniref:Uncharacterized protein n=2 Tax=Spirodela intermedia TaxID=51605 RepID=A0A7I8IB06_SPIIN|nr:unnamed protein product [Spirodela intermedia]CAA6654760.1 unnamed protein product [Spirodela intermedia]CAA7389429.1 unnamed protein product [Spirodela intermedia]